MAFHWPWAYKPASFYIERYKTLCGTILCLTPPQLRISGGHCVVRCGLVTLSIHHRAAKTLYSALWHTPKPHIACYLYLCHCHHQIAAAIIS